MSGTRPPSSLRVRRTASITYFKCSSGSTAWSLVKSAADRIVSGKRGPTFSMSSYGSPIASGTTRMSLKRMAASTPSKSTGWIVTSQASSGVSTSSLNPESRLRTARYSGRMRPAWRITQTGGRSVISPFKARRRRSFWRVMVGSTVLDGRGFPKLSAGS